MLNQGGNPASIERQIPGNDGPAGDEVVNDGAAAGVTSWIRARSPGEAFWEWH
jgi:hypothetical protein